MKMNLTLNGLAFSILALASTAAWADAVTNTDSAALTFTINSISNSDGNSNDLADLSISASFQQPTDSSDYYAASTGSGSYQLSNPNTSIPALTGNVFSNTMNASAQGVAANDTADTVTTGNYVMTFNNAGSVNSYTVDLSLSYLLSAVSSGLNASSSIVLNYGYTGINYSGSTGSPFSGYDYVASGTYSGYSLDSENQPGSTELIFTLSPGERETFNATAVITTDLQMALAASVPLPASIWLFGCALAGIAGNASRRKVR